MIGFLEMPSKSLEKDFPEVPHTGNKFYITDEGKFYLVTKVYWHTSGQHNSQIQLRVVLGEIPEV